MKAIFAVSIALLLAGCCARMPDEPAPLLYDCTPAYEVPTGEPTNKELPIVHADADGGLQQCGKGTKSVCWNDGYWCCPRRCGEYQLTPLAQ